MDEQLFLTVADAKLGQIEVALERLIDESDVDIDVELKDGGVMEIACANGSKIIINRHSAAREIWIAARSGGYHFAYHGNAWLAARDGTELMQVLSRCLTEQTGTVIALDHPA